METLERLAQLLVTRCLLELGELGRRYYSSLSAVMSHCSGGNEMATCCKEDYHKLLSTSLHTFLACVYVMLAVLTNANFMD